MVYEHLRFAYPGAFAALCRSSAGRHAVEGVSQKEQAGGSTPCGVGPDMAGPAGARSKRAFFGKRHRSRQTMPVTPPMAAMGGSSKRAGQSSSIKPAWSPVLAEPCDPPRVQMQRDNVSLRLAVDAAYAQGGLQRRRPTTQGHARQILAQYHVAHHRAPDGGFFMVSGADGFDVGLVKPHSFKRDVMSKVYTLTVR